MSNKRVQQQLYTRERGGVFLSTDGYDTIAISPGLDKGFVKKYLHPVCVYHTPTELKKRGEKDAALYPPAFTVIQPETGDMVVGQSVFVPADFTGQRSTFFMHNYIVSADIKENWIRNPASLFQIEGFQESYNVIDGKSLPELDGIPYRNEEIHQKKAELFRVLELDEIIFKKLLFACMSSISSKKKVYISLNVSLTEHNKYALLLLELIYSYMPYAARRRFGAVTFSTEPESKKYVNVIFVEAGGLNARDRSLEKQYVFDFINKQITGVELEGEHEYLEFAWKQLSSSIRMDKFFEFAEHQLQGLEERIKNEFSTYYQLAAIYQLKNGDTSFYEKNKVGILNGILTFLGGNIRDKKELLVLFRNLVEKEGTIKDSVVVHDYLKAMLTFEKMIQHPVFSVVIANTLIIYEKQEMFTKLWELIEQYPARYNHLLTLLTEKYPELLTSYLEVKFNNQANLGKVLKEIEKLLKAASVLLRNNSFIKMSIKQLLLIVQRESQPFQAVIEVRSFINKLQVSQNEHEFLEYKIKLFYQLEMQLLKQIQLQKVTREEIKLFGQLFVLTPSNRVLEGPVKETSLIMESLYRLFFERLTTPDLYTENLSKDTSEKWRAIVKRLYKEKMSEQTPERLYIPFSLGYGEFNYREMLRFVSAYGTKKQMLEFILTSYNKFARNVHFTRDLKEYLIEDQNSIWKDKASKKELKRIKSSSFRRMITQVEHETASPFVRFLRKQAFMITITISSIAVLVLGGILVFNLLFNQDEPVNGSNQETLKQNEMVENDKSRETEKVIKPSNDANDSDQDEN